MKIQIPDRIKKVLTKVGHMLSIIFWCKIMDSHDWTSDAQKGIEPTDEQVKASLMGFRNYSAMYCDRCGHYSKLNDRW